MPPIQFTEPDRRVLLFAPKRRDAEVTRNLLEKAELECVACPDLPGLRRELAAGAGAVLATGEALAQVNPAEFLAILEAQPPWSDVPVVLLVRGVDESPVARGVIAALSNVTLLERPAPTRSVISAVQAAVRNRERQYEIRDRITALHREQARSRQLREELALAVDASELGTFHCPYPWGEIRWNARCKELFWLPPDARVDFDLFYAIIHPDDRERTRRAVAACIEEGKPYAVTYRTVSPGGEERYVLATGRTYFNGQGQPTRFDGTAQDVTEQRLAEQALSESETRFRQLADAMPQIVWTARPDGMLDYVNRRWYEYIDRTEAEVSPAEWHLRVHPEDVGRANAAWGAAVRTGSLYSIEFRVQGADGEFRWFLVRAVPIREADGGIAQWYGTCTDIHDGRALLEENAALLDRERAAREEAERASRMKDDFLATLSHELRTPLNAILGWAHLLRGPSMEAAEITEGLTIIERNARAQSQIIEDLLDMSRIISGKVRLDVRRTDLAPIVEAAVETVGPAAAAKGIRLQAVLDPAARPISGDANRLQQVFWNLLTNAIKFTPRGGRVQVVLARVESHLEVSVSDTGRGIEAAFLPYVFDRFRQADSSTTRQFGGLGLGLAIVKQLVELHGGTVRVRSAGQDQGTTFVVALPLSLLHAEPAPTPATRHPGADEAAATPAALVDGLKLTGVHALVVDDEADARGLVKRLLEARGASVAMAGSAAEALAQLRGGRFDVLISDIGMPGQDGYALIKQIRALGPEGNRAIPAVALTAYARSEDRTRAVLAGFQTHITKPVEPAELLTMVASLTGRTG